MGTLRAISELFPTLQERECHFAIIFNSKWIYILVINGEIYAKHHKRHESNGFTKFSQANVKINAMNTQFPLIFSISFLIAQSNVIRQTIMKQSLNLTSFLVVLGNLCIF